MGLLGGGEGSAGILGLRGAGAAELRWSGLQGPGAPLSLALPSPSALCPARSCPATQLPARLPALIRGADGCAQRQHLDALLHPGDPQ